jgi:gliding motility-associated-like protein
VNPAPDATIAAAGPFCITDGAATLTAATAGGTWSGTGITNASAGTFDPATAGIGTWTITYTVTAGNGCIDTDTQVITVGPPPDATITAAGPFCSNVPAVTLTAATGGGTWSGPGITDGTAGTFDPATAGAGTWTITYTVTIGGCTDTKTRSITVNPAPNATIAAAGPFCITDGAATLTASTGGGTWSGTGITNASAGTFDPATAGVGTWTITYTVTAGNGCTDTRTRPITVAPIPDATITAAGPFCTNDITVTLTSATAGGTWSGPGITSASAGTFNPATAGAGTWTITHGVTIGGCTDAKTTNITVNLAPDATIAAAGPFCPTDGVATLTAATAGGTWSGPGITSASAGTFDPALAGVGTWTITYTVTAVNGCTDTKTRPITVATPNATISAAGPFCSNVPAVTLTAATAGGTWSGTGITDAAAGTFDPAVAGAGTWTITYSLTIGSCSDTKTRNITVNPAPDATISAAGPFCVTDGAATLTAATAGGTWSGTGITSASLGTFDPATAGVGSWVITYTITAGNGCVDTDTRTIVVGSPNATITAVGPFCTNNLPVTLTAATAGGTWSGTGITDPAAGTFDPGTAGAGTWTITYTLTIGGCTDTKTTNITVNPGPDATINAAGPFCITDGAVNLVAATAGGTWSGAGITSASAGTFNPATAGVGTWTITYTVTAGNGCVDTDTQDIDVANPPDATIAAAGPFCTSDGVVTLTATTAGGTWSGAGITNGSTGAFDPAIAGVGTWPITHTITIGGCTDTDTRSITVSPGPDASITAVGPFCITDGAVNLVAATAGGTWSGAGITDGTLGTFDPTVAGVGTWTITYTVTAVNGCIDTDTEDIMVAAPPNATITPVGPFCSNDPAVTLAAVTSGGTWSGAGVNATTGVFTPGTAGAGPHTITYTVTIGGCTDTKTATIVVNQAPSASISGGTAICNGNNTSLPVTFTGTAPWTFSYTSFDATNGTTTFGPFTTSFPISITANPTETTTYTIVSVSDASVAGCAGSITGAPAVVTVNNPPSASLAVTPTIDPLCTGGSTTVKIANAQNNVSYQLRNDADNSLIGPAVTGTGVDLLLPTGPLATTTTFNVLASVTGCTAVPLTAKATINVTGAVNAGLTVAAETDPICTGTSTNIKITASENGVLYQLRNDADDSDINGTVAGTGGDILLPTGTLTATTTFNILANNGSCSIELTNRATVNVDVAPNPALAVSVVPSTPVCVGGQANITVASSQNNLIYQLRNDADDSNVGSPVTGNGGTISLPTGALNTTTVFNILVTSGACGSVELTATAQVVVNGTLDVTLAVTAAASLVCEGDATTITITNAESGVDYQLMDDLGNNIGTPVAGAGANISIPTGAINRTTTFSVLADNGTCSIQLTNTAQVTMDVAPDPAITVQGPSTAVCIGGSANITVQASESGVNYQLFNDDTNTAIGSAVAGTGANLLLSTGVLNTTTNFRVEASSAGGACPMVVLTTKPQVVVGGTIDKTLAVTNNAPTPFCSGSLAFVKVAGSQTGVNYQLQLSPAGTNVNGVVAGNGGLINLPTGNLATTTTFQVLASNATCSIVLDATTLINVSPAPNTGLSVTTDSPICPNTAATITVHGSQSGVNYQLRNNVGNALVGPSVPGNGGDIALSTGNLSAAANFNILAGSGSCTAQLTAAISISLRAATDPICTGSTGNCATVVIIPRPHPTNCTLSTGSVTFTVKPFHPTVVTASSELEITINGPVNRTNINDTTFYGLPLGNYTYSIQYGQTTCLKTGSFTIDQSGTVGTPVASGIVQPNCAGSNQGAVTINIAGETGNAMQWSYDAGITDPWKPFTVGGQITGITAGPAPSFQRVISVRRNASDPCNAAVTIVIQDKNAAIAATFDIGEATCNGNDGTLTVNAAGGTGGYQYSLDQVIYQSSKDFTGLTGGGGTVFVKDNSGCEVSLPYVVTFPGLIPYDTPVPSPASCTNNGESGNITFTLSGTVGSGQYVAGISTDMITEPAKYRAYKGSFIVFDSLAAGTYYIFIKSATNSSVCPTRTSGILVAGVQPITYKLRQGCDASGISADKPYLFITDITGDMDFIAPPVQVQVDRVFPPALNILTKSGIDLSAGENSFSFTYDGDPSFMQFPGEYLITLTQVSASAGCPVKKSFKYTVPIPLTATVGGSTKSYPEIPSGSLQIVKFFGGIAPYDIRVELDSAASFSLPSYATDFEEVTANSNLDYAKLYRNIPAGRYKVQVVDSVGCFIEFAGRVPLDTDVYIPNIFTPNDDGVNDVFFIRNLPSPGAKLVITNRWGKEVFSSGDYKNDWKADNVSDGIYFYRLQGTSSEVKTMSGWIEILRGNKP